MPILDKMTNLQLNKLLQELEEELRSVAPTVVAQMELVKSVLKSREAEVGPFASCTMAAEAVDLCFKMYGDFKMTKKEILKTILDGGYVGKNPRAARQQLTDRLNYLLENDILVLKGDLVGHNPKRSSRS